MSAAEVWLRGALPDVAPLLQPVAHSLMQSSEEMRATLPSLSVEQVWWRPGTSASIGYHARHAAGSLDRLLTYARGEALSPTQLVELALEDDEEDSPHIGADLSEVFEQAVATALAQVRSTDASTLIASRDVGRARLPSTVIGLLVHAAEHTQRHVGQIVTLARSQFDSASGTST